MIGTIVCKAEVEGDGIYRGYIAMLAVSESYRKRGIGRELVCRIMKRMVQLHCEEITLETEVEHVL